MVSRKNQSINVPEVFQEVKDGGEPEMLYVALTVGIEEKPEKNQLINVPEVFQEVKDGGEPEMLYAALTVRIDGEPQVLRPTLNTAGLKGKCHEMDIFSCLHTIITLFPLCSLEIFFSSRNFFVYMPVFKLRELAWQAGALTT